MDQGAPFRALEGAGIGAGLSLTAERLKEMRRSAESLLDPLGMVAPIVHAQHAWGLHPLEFWELATRFGADLLTLQLHTGAKLAGRDVADVVVPQSDDLRFADPVWTREPFWDLLKQWYLFYTRHVQDALFQTPGLSPRERRRAAFWWRQWLNAAAPTNFLATNPVAMRKAIESSGESLSRGFQIFLEDQQAGTVRMTDPKDFTVGANLATTAGAVVFRNRLIELIHYAPRASAVRPTPIVLVTPWINKFYVLDLQPKKSMVRHLLDQGFDVYIVSWKNPGAEMRDTGFDDYVTEGIDPAVRVARELSGAESVHAVGYCIGGTLLSVYMAWLSRRLPRESVPVAHWTLLASLVDFQSPGDIEVFLDEGSVNWIADTMRTRGYLDGAEMAATLPPPPPNPPLPHSPPRLPCRMPEHSRREMYLKNTLVRPGAFTIAGEPIELARIHTPLYVVASEDDHITPWRQVFRVNNWVTGPKRFVLSSSGHILGIVNPPVSPPKRRYQVGAAHRGEAADAWLAAAEQHAGTWWEDWTAWLAERCGEPRTPPPLATGAYPKLADAPGTYVLER